jgi:hypothetical protein
MSASQTTKEFPDFYLNGEYAKLEVKHDNKHPFGKVFALVSRNKRIVLNPSVLIAGIQENCGRFYTR